MVYWFLTKYTRCSIDKIHKQQREIHSKWVLTEELTNIEANEQNEKSEYCFHHNQICRQSPCFYHSNPTRLLWLGSNCNWVLSIIYFLHSQRTNEILAFILYTCFHQSESLTGYYGACGFLDFLEFTRKLPFIDFFSESWHISGRKLTSNQVWHWMLVVQWRQRNVPKVCFWFAYFACWACGSVITQNNSWYATISPEKSTIWWTENEGRNRLPLVPLIERFIYP